jgi:hypothetical protein
LERFDAALALSALCCAALMIFMADTLASVSVLRRLLQGQLSSWPSHERLFLTGMQRMFRNFHNKAPIDLRNR